jgi:glycerol kinase
MDRVFKPSVRKEDSEKLIAQWSKAVERTKHWID